MNFNENNWLLILHIATATVGETIFVLAFCVSLLYLYYYKKLKQRIVHKRIAITSLSSLENITSKSLYVGFFFITLSLISGVALIFFGDISIQKGYFKIFWAFLVWGWYVSAIFGRNLFGWRGYKGAKLVILGMLILISGLFGMAFFYR